jgi:hypothetical protein
MEQYAALDEAEPGRSVVATLPVFAVSMPDLSEAVLSIRLTHAFCIIAIRAFVTSN